MKLSIVTINKNNPSGLLKTMTSVVKTQELVGNLEWVIIDGLSSTGDLCALDSLPNKDWITVVSERDDGIYDAMNKGWRLSKGEFILYLNSGDFFMPEDFFRFFENFTKKESGDIFYAKVRLYDKEMKPGAIHGPSHDQLNKTTIAHMSAVTRRQVFLSLNGFNTSYRIAGDREFFIRAKKHGFKFEQIDYVIAGFPQNGISTSYYQTRREDLKVSLKHGYLGWVRFIFKRLQLAIRKKLQEQ